MTWSCRGTCCCLNYCQIRYISISIWSLTDYVFLYIKESIKYPFQSYKSILFIAILYYSTILLF